ncbi:catalase/hydroperoxidase HPI(I) [Alteromonadales bacterium TW-7]|nr:catalase/hydroperoxidase HPI(I) [Alteromonadales bacterium TW-7]
MCAVVNQSHFQTLHIPLRRYFLIRSSLFKKRSKIFKGSFLNTNQKYKSVQSF